MKNFTALLLLFLVTSTAALAATADDATPTEIGTFGHWKAYSFKDKGKNVCFMQEAPDKQDGIGNKKRGPVLLFITHWPAEKSKNVVSVAGGYAYKDGSTVDVAAGEQKFQLFTQGETAWTKDQTTDDAIADALRKEKELTVSGESKHGTKTTDTYDLTGSADAYKAISKKCGI